jgi:hypothetical protein
MIFTKKYIANPLILQYVILSMRNSYNTSDSFVSKLSKNSADLKPVSTALNKFKKRKNLFSFRFISASQSLGHLGRMSGALCDLDEI